MASWKKVIVSGSNAHLASVTASSAIAVGANQIITTTQTGTVLTGSFTGSFTGAFSGNGSGLTNIIATSINFPNNPSGIVNSDFVLVSSSAGLGRITYSDFLNDLAGTNLINESNDSLALNSTITGLTSVSATSFTGSLSGNASSATVATQVANSLTAGNGISMPSYNGSAASTVQIKTGSVFSDDAILKWDTGANAFESSSLTDNGTVISGNTSIQLTGANSRLSGSFSGSFFGSGAGLTDVGANVSNFGDNRILTSTGTATGITAETNLTFNDVTNTLAVPGPTNISGLLTLSNGLNSTTNPLVLGTSIGTVNVGGNSTTAVNIGTATANNTVSIGSATSTTTIGNNLIVNGNLSANGTVSFISSSNLFVGDRFAVFASGSNGTSDAGIIIQTSSLPAGTGSGIALYLEAAFPTTPRWAVSSNVRGDATSATPESYMVTATSSAAIPSAAPFWGGSDIGHGNIYINSSDESIWIYS